MSFKGGIALSILIVSVVAVVGFYFTDQLNPAQVEINLNTLDAQLEEELRAIGVKTVFVKHTQQGSIAFLSRPEFVSKIGPGDKVYVSLVLTPDETHIQQVAKRYYSEKYNISYEEIQNRLPFEKHSFRLIKFDPEQSSLALAKTWNPRHFFLISFFVILVLEAIVLFFIPD